jgi:hypothetical protein
MREAMGRRGRELSSGKFSYDNWISRTVEVFGQVRQEFIEKHT